MIRFPALRRKHKMWLGLLVLGMALLIAAWQYWRVRDWGYLQYYAWTSSEAKVETPADLAEVLKPFERIRFQNLPAAYRSKTLSNEAPFRGILASRRYYVIPRRAIYRKLVGDFRIRDFLPRDRYFKNCILGREASVYWLVDIRLLQKFLAFQEALRKKGYDDSAFYIYNGYRHPAYNKRVGGASRSRHIVGEAVDISIRDINQDGRSTQEDKAIVLEILDRQIIGNGGGLGKYPGTMSVHFDVRGYRARWDKQ
ncbi:MAG: D-Ala-D-Ala carboxypeptidase family metallohydrolase [Bacteroidota bacterium]